MKLLAMALVLAWLSCACVGGSDTMLPDALDHNFDRAEKAFEEGDYDRGCSELGQLRNGLYEWMDNASGNLTVVADELVQSMEGLAYACGINGLGAPQERPSDFEEQFERWAENARRRTHRDTSSGARAWFWYILVPLVLGAGFAFWRRKFRDA